MGGQESYRMHGEEGEGGGGGGGWCGESDELGRWRWDTIPIQTEQLGGTERSAKQRQPTNLGTEREHLKGDGEEMNYEEEIHL